MTREDRKERTPMAHRGRLQVLRGFRCSRCSHFLLPFRSFALLSDLGAGDESICEALIEGDAAVAEDSTGLPLLHGNLKRVELVLLRPLQSAN
jgi:hypothetical protein